MKNYIKINDHNTLGINYLLDTKILCYAVSIFYLSRLSFMTNDLRSTLMYVNDQETLNGKFKNLGRFCEKFK